MQNTGERREQYKKAKMGPSFVFVPNLFPGANHVCLRLPDNA